MSLLIPEPASAQSESGTPRIVATLVQKLTGESGHEFTTEGSAYIVPGSGLQVNESGINILSNQDFESGIDTWVGTGNSFVSANSGGAYLGSGSLRVEYDPEGEGSGTVTGLSTGSISSSDIIPEKSYTFSVYVKTEYGTVADLWLLVSGNMTGQSLAGPFQATTEWQRFSVTTTLGPEDTGLEASVWTGGTSSADIFIDAAQLEMKNHLTPFFDGSSVGCRWEGEPHMSRSVREGGYAMLATESGIDFNQPFWFAIETTLGFNRSDIIGSDPVGSKDFVNIGKPNGRGTGMLNNVGIILDYYSITKNVCFAKLGGRGTLQYNTSTFNAGDEMLVVCAYDPLTGMDMWIKIGETPVVHRYDRGYFAKMSPNIPPDYSLSVSDSGAWNVFGDYQSNSLHRNLIVSQDRISPDIAEEYIADPELFLQMCVSKPGLSLSKRSVAWATFSDYQNRLLSVDYELGIISSEFVNNVAFLGSIDTNAVMLSSISQDNFASIGGQNTTAAFTVQYLVPAGVSTFNSSLFFAAEDVCGNTYEYPGPYPG
ncbi:MAG: carbohydrate binding domain-containing protein [Thermoleophilia bacterium]|nr:carbohydrate binding domain-containing protein [Thermoleophilia bacterium]